MAETELERVHRILDTQLRQVVPDDERRLTFMEVLEEYVKTVAEHVVNDRLDREFNRGDYRY
jgi:hypothetical protein